MMSARWAASGLPQCSRGRVTMVMAVTLPAVRGRTTEIGSVSGWGLGSFPRRVGVGAFEPEGLLRCRPRRTRMAVAKPPIEP